MALNMFNLAPMLEKQKLAANGENYADWIRSLRVVLRSAKDYVLDQPLGDPRGGCTKTSSGCFHY